MKLTGLLKSKVEAASTKEEKKSIIAEAGMELTDDELEGVAGGSPLVADSSYIGRIGKNQKDQVKTKPDLYFYITDVYTSVELVKSSPTEVIFMPFFLQNICQAAL